MSPRDRREAMVYPAPVGALVRCPNGQVGRVTRQSELGPWVIVEYEEPRMGVCCVDRCEVLDAT